jgi:type IV secretory pathway VirJ component
MNPTASSLRRRPPSIPGARVAAVSALVLAMVALAPTSLAAQIHEIRGHELPAPMRDLPLVQISVPPKAGRPMALVMSGDGDWARFIRDLGDTLAAHGIPVIGLESRAWMKGPRTPEELATDMERVLRYYMKAWGVDRFIIVGYSRGADWTPFLVNRLPADLRSELQGIALFSPALEASFEFHLEDLVRFVHRKTNRATLPEMDEIHDLPVLCVYGVRDKEALCPSLTPEHAEIVKRDAGHGLHDPGELADLVIARMGGESADRSGTTGTGGSGGAAEP